MATEPSYTFTVRGAGWDNLLRSPTGAYAQWLTRVGNQMVSAAKRRANVDTGLMRSRVEFRIEVQSGKVVGILAARTGYAKFVHDGTRYRRGNPFLTDAVRETL